MTDPGEFFESFGQFKQRNGVAKDRGMKNTCNKRVCFVTNDERLLQELLITISKSNDCFEVKYCIRPRGTSYLGICHFTNESTVGDIWARYELHPQIWTTVQDEDFCGQYRSKIRTYI